MHLRKRMKIVADSYIPFLKGLLDDVAQVEYLPPVDITAEAVKDADALIIRTRTKCNEALLKDSKIIIFDHILCFLYRTFSKFTIKTQFSYSCISSCFIH